MMLRGLPGPSLTVWKGKATGAASEWCGVGRRRIDRWSGGRERGRGGEGGRQTNGKSPFYSCCKPLLR